MFKLTDIPIVPSTGLMKKGRRTCGKTHDKSRQLNNYVVCQLCIYGDCDVWECMSRRLKSVVSRFQLDVYAPLVAFGKHVCRLN